MRRSFTALEAAGHQDRKPEPSARRVFCFSVQAAADPGTMPRILELFAKRNLVPSRWHSDLDGPGDERLAIDIQVADLTPELSDYVARCIRQIHGVETVLTCEKGTV
jgi:hypothetical protein